MAKFKLAKTVFANSGEDWNYEEVGVLSKVCKGHTLRFGNNNLKKEKKDDGSYNRVIIFAVKGDDTFNIPCSEPLSKSIRLALSKGKSKKEVLASLVGLSIQSEVDNPEKYFLMAPAGMSEGFLIEDLVEEEVTFDELVAF